MECKICSSNSSPVFQLEVLHKHNVQYYKCDNCLFIQTEEPFWLEEAYSTAITSLDLGLLQRNFSFLSIVEALIKSSFNRRAKFVDYGGGYGVFVRLMRDRGFDFYRQDIYCENLFAKGFDIADINDEKFELLTAFELFEHLVSPKKELEKMLSLSDNIFFTTTVYPENEDLKKWWYLIPETGQHVSLYSKKSLQTLAAQYGLKYLSYGSNFHLFTKTSIGQQKFNLVFNPIIKRLINKAYRLPSLLETDFNKIAHTKM